MSSLTTNSLRSSLRRVASCSRYASSQASSSLPRSSSSSTPKLDIQPKAELTEDKMRALVDLYHETPLFINKANLDERIDEAFIHRQQRTQEYLGIRETSTAQLETHLYQRRAQPKFGQMVHPTARKNMVKDSSSWAEQRSPREAAVFTTLYGVYGRGKPAYDALMDQQRGPEVVEEAVELDASEAGQPKEKQSESGIDILLTSIHGQH